MDKTTELWKRACNVLAAGRWNPSSGRDTIPGGSMPLMMKDCRGCRSTDTDGKTYIDYMMGWGTALLGFRHPAVEAAVRKQLEHGITPTLMNPVEIEVAEQLVSMIPCAEQVAFGKSGSGVLAIAARLARGYTRREKILFCGFHGIHDWYMASVPGCPGIPESLRSLVIPFPYNDLDALRNMLEENKGEVAAIFMEATCEVLPDPGFLEGVRALATEHGAALVFDEVITGFRVARGGAQEYFGVKPDMACFNKVMANGMPLSALVGPSQLAEAMSAIMYGATFRGEALSLAAAEVTLQIFKNEPITEHLWSVGDRIRSAVTESGVKIGVPVSLHGVSPRMSFHIDPPEGLHEGELLTLFIQECALRGVLHNGHLLPSYAHDESAVEESCGVFHDALEVVARAMDQGSTEGLLHVPPIVLWTGNEGEAPPDSGEGGAC